jgi:hypothetical protein
MLEGRSLPWAPMQPLCRDRSTRRRIPDSHAFFTMRKKFFHDGLLRSLRISPSLTVSNFALRAIGERQDEFD